MLIFFPIINVHFHFDYFYIFFYSNSSIVRSEKICKFLTENQQVDELLFTDLIILIVIMDCCLRKKAISAYPKHK